MWSSAFGKALMNLAQMLPRQSLNYMDQADALKWLKEQTGQDFGTDVAEWERWCITERLLYPGWQSISSGGRLGSESGR
jgi:hypothetical protein